MIFSHEKEVVKCALYVYMQEISSGNIKDEKSHYSFAQKIFERLERDPDPIGGFIFGDYKSHANDECGYNLTDTQVNDLMAASKKMYSAEIGMNWDVMSDHIGIWAEENNIPQPIDSDDDL